ncbi:hypothetical protein [Nocardia fluminea]|uniref:hypothetical protein n=1 Tax=Nocardia fluminea TaxID=134984 RepID=UPI0033E1C818
MAVDVSEVFGRVVSEAVWVRLFVGAEGVEVVDCGGVDSEVAVAEGVCGSVGAVGVVPFSAVSGDGFCCVGGEFGGALSEGAFDEVETSWEGRSSDDPVGLGGLREEVSTTGVSVVGCGLLLVVVDTSVSSTLDGVASPWSGVSLGPLVFGFGWVVPPVDGVSVGLLLWGLDGSVSSGEFSGAAGLFGVEGAVESAAPFPSAFEGAESLVCGAPFVPLLFGVSGEVSPAVGASGALFWGEGASLPAAAWSPVDAVGESLSVPDGVVGAPFAGLSLSVPAGMVGEASLVGLAVSVPAGA